MKPEPIINRIEELLREDTDIWLSIDPREIAAQLQGIGLSPETQAKIRRSEEIQAKLNSLNTALAAQKPPDEPFRPGWEVPLH